MPGKMYCVHNEDLHFQMYDIWYIFFLGRQMKLARADLVLEWGRFGPSIVGDFRVRQIAICYSVLRRPHLT